MGIYASANEPSGSYAGPVVLPGRWEYLGIERVTETGAVDIPAGADCFSINCVAATVRYRINGTASSTAGDSLAEGAIEYVPPLSNLESLHVYISGGEAVIKFFQAFGKHTQDN